MTQRDLLYASKWLICLVVFIVGISSAEAQRQNKKRPGNPVESFLDTQFWLGLRFGTNITQAYPGERFSGFSPINYNADTLNKTYENYNIAGGQFGIEMNFYHRGFSVSFQPTIKRTRYRYSSALNWDGESISSLFELTYTVDQKLDQLELPLVLKYDLIQQGKVRPFLMGGGYYAMILSAQKEVSISQVDYSSGTPLPSEVGITTLGVTDAFRNFYGWTAGGGVNLDYWNIRTVIEIGYKHGFTAATATNVRQNELASLGEVNDELFLRDINFSVSFVFPFRYIDKTFQPY